MSKLIPITVLIIALVAVTIGFFGGAFQRDEPMVAEHQEPILIEGQQPGVVEPEEPTEAPPALAQTSEQPAAPRKRATVQRETRTSTAAQPEVRVTRRSGKPEFVVATASGTSAADATAPTTANTGTKRGGWVTIPGTGVGLVPKK